MGIYKYLTKNISKGTKERKEIKKIIHFNNIVKNSLINTFTLHTINYILLDGCLLKIFFFIYFNRSFAHNIQCYHHSLFTDIHVKVIFAFLYQYILTLYLWKQIVL